ncbi:hypothetical protein PHLGIDRAFT_469946 [Phlebiopsis gigantea 11061_1 CR5-6]|uniref:Protein kinase domain-containing protein n=1 Tax=Phlebiopsis gigantea (strain 11061_1 CR5-6) TaxID=745531 RepID=A0A0C3S9G4_PHLG1|nr:hypothetical protein PHLGIDRAFT_469946 [Phlebiopsis gigantea 11061_1 CR5-6]
MEVKPLVIKAKTPTVGTTLRSNAGVTGAPQLPEDAAPEPVNYSAKIHHRIVFTEVGTTIAEVDSLVDALIAMVGATKALYTLHRCGWVHRDISVGNILVVNGRGKLTDVEYAKKESKVTSHDGVRTGTLFFMSPEVENQRYIYNEVVAAVQGQLEGAQSTTNCHTLEEESEALVASILLARRKASGAAKPPVPPQDATSVHDKISIPFKHNPLHDLESMIWVVIWLFVCSKFVKPTNPKLSEDEWASILDSHAKFSKRLFRDEGFRRDAMTTDGTLLDGFDTTLPQLLNPAKELDAVRVKLIAQFVAVHKQRKQTKAQVPFEDMISPDLHTTIIKFLERVALDLANADEDLAINVSAWAEQRKNMRDLVVDDAPTTSTRRTSNALQDGASQSRKRPKTHRGQSATAARPYSLPSGPSGGTRLRARMNQFLACMRS